MSGVPAAGFVAPDPSFPPRRLTQTDFARGAAHVQAREQELRDFLRPAQEIYTGEQHVRLMRGVAKARKAGMECAVSILSAGY